MNEPRSGGAVAVGAHPEAREIALERLGVHRERPLFGLALAGFRIREALADPDAFIAKRCA